MEDELRPCSRCGAPFAVNPRSRATHRFCSKGACQAERRRLAQLSRRKTDGRPPLSDASKERHAAYMQDYRRAQKRQRKRPLSPPPGASTQEPGAGVREAGSMGDAAIVYVVPGPGPGIRLRVVSEAGLCATFDVPDTSGDSDPRVKEAG
jgi:hypothetical protein